MPFNALNKTRLGLATPRRPCSSSAPVLGSPHACSDPATVFQLSGLAWNSRYNMSHAPNSSSVGTHCCRFAVMLHIWSTGTSGQLLREGWSRAGVHKQEGQGKSWRISEMSWLSPCSLSHRQTKPSCCWVENELFQEKWVTSSWTLL